MSLFDPDPDSDSDLDGQCGEYQAGTITSKIKSKSKSKIGGAEGYGGQVALRLCPPGGISAQGAGSRLLLPGCLLSGAFFQASDKGLGFPLAVESPFLNHAVPVDGNRGGNDLPLLVPFFE